MVKSNVVAMQCSLPVKGFNSQFTSSNDVWDKHMLDARDYSGLTRLLEQKQL